MPPSRGRDFSPSAEKHVHIVLAIRDAQSVVSLLPFAHTDSTTAVFASSATDTRRGFGTPFRRQSTRHNARATGDESSAIKVIARCTNVSLDDICVGVRRAFVVSSGFLSGSVVRDRDKCDFARLMDAIVTCIESSPLLCLSVEGECTGSPSLQQRTGWSLHRHWHQQRHAIRLWAVALREKARSLRQGVSHSLDHLVERLRVKVYRWMHDQSAKLQECHSDWPATCPHFVVEVAVKAERVPVPDGWDHPSFSKSSSFGPWLQCNLLHYSAYPAFHRMMWGWDSDEIAENQHKFFTFLSLQ